MDESSGMVNILLPWPPSVNNYWRRCGSRYFVSAAGKKFREEVCYRSQEFKSKFGSTKLSVTIQAYPPDKRRRDLDNILKSLLDSLQHAEVYEDDNQIDRLLIERFTPLSGVVLVSIEPI